MQPKTLNDKILVPREVGQITVATDKVYNSFAPTDHVHDESWISNWISLPLTVNWAAYGGTWQGPRLRNISGLVIAEGLISGRNTIDYSVGTIPVGFRPRYECRMMGCGRVVYKFPTTIDTWTRSEALFYAYPDGRIILTGENYMQAIPLFVSLTGLWWLTV